MMRLTAVFVAVAVLLAAMLVNAEVVKLTADNFDSIVLDPSKDVFVKFFAPWCGHCVRMAGAWEELSNAGTGAVIADLDATQFQAVSSKYGVRGFPTIKLFTKTDKSGKAFQGARDVESLKKFLKENI
jgi:protein disulfide-isomerase-like protein